MGRFSLFSQNFNRKTFIFFFPPREKSRLTTKNLNLNLGRARVKSSLHKWLQGNHDSFREKRASTAFERAPLQKRLSQRRDIRLHRRNSGLSRILIHVRAAWDTRNMGRFTYEVTVFGGKPS